MKTTIIAATIFAAMATQAQSQDICTGIGDLAESIMSARQSGVPMSRAMEVPNATADEGAAELARAIVMSAYDRPSFMTEAAQDRSIANFRNDWELVCYQARQ